MRLPKFSLLVFLTLAGASSLLAAEITGKVRDASGDAATVVLDGDALPAVGDSAEIFFKIQGADEEISVASGKVAAVEAKVVKIKIEKATGTIEKDQLARIKSGSPPTTAGTSPSPAASPSTPAPTSPSIIGDWVGDAGREGTVSLSFKADGTLLWVVEDEKSGMSTLAKYRINSSTKPQSLEAFDFEEGPLKGGKLHGSFELQSDGRLKLEFDEKEPPKEFTKDAVVFSKATSPIVRPPEKKLADPSLTAVPSVTPSAMVPPLSPAPTPTPKKEGGTTTEEPPHVGQMASQIVTFDELPAGPISADVFSIHGIRLVKGKGTPTVFKSEPNMVLPRPCQSVLMVGDVHVTSVTVMLDPPVKRFALYRIGTRGGASTPTWKMMAYNAKGKLIGSTGEIHGLPKQPMYFGIDGDNITRVEISTDNRQGSGTWATWSSLPIAGFGFDR